SRARSGPPAPACPPPAPAGSPPPPRPPGRRGRGRARPPARPDGPRAAPAGPPPPPGCRPARAVSPTRSPPSGTFPPGGRPRWTSPSPPVPRGRRTAPAPARSREGDDPALRAALDALPDLLVHPLHELVEVGARHHVGLADGAHLEVAHRRLVGLGGGRLRHLPRGDRLLHLGRQGLDPLQLGHGVLVVAEARLRPAECLVFVALAD